MGGAAPFEARVGVKRECPTPQDEGGFPDAVRGAGSIGRLSGVILPSTRLAFSTDDLTDNTFCSQVSGGDQFHNVPNTFWGEIAPFQAARDTEQLEFVRGAA